MQYDIYQSKITKWLVVANLQNITGVYPQTHRLYDSISKQYQRQSSQIINKAIYQLDEYFNHKRTDFELPICAEGTDFQNKIWKELLKINYSETTSYGEIAKQINSPKASRACGAAIGKNPISIIIPCHRIIGKSGDLTGYAGGIELKKWLLSHESSKN
jgi:methylated-DNA-[protein]-cysteine S-methyltransferase